MKVNINSLKFKVDRKLELFVEDKVSKLSNIYDGVIGSDVVLRLDHSDTRDNKVAEIRLFVRGTDLFAKKQCKTFEEAADSAVDALKKQLTRHKDRVKNK